MKSRCAVGRSFLTRSRHVKERFRLLVLITQPSSSFHFASHPFAHYEHHTITSAYRIDQRETTSKSKCTSMAPKRRGKRATGIVLLKGVYVNDEGRATSARALTQQQIDHRNATGSEGLTKKDGGVHFTTAPSTPLDPFQHGHTRTADPSRPPDEPNDLPSFPRPPARALQISLRRALPSLLRTALRLLQQPRHRRESLLYWCLQALCLERSTASVAAVRAISARELERESGVVGEGCTGGRGVADETCWGVE